MNSLIKNWYYIVVYVAGIYALIAILGNFTFQIKILLASLVFIHLHFYEEFGCPGGFPSIGMEVEMHQGYADPKTWDLNLLSSLFGNEWFAIIVYLLPIFLPQIHFLTLAAVIFAFLEFIMHAIVFNFKLKRWYNPGLFTTVFGLVPISIFYFLNTKVTHSWQDWLLSIVWVLLNYWIAFRSPIYKHFGSKKEYTFSNIEIDRANKYMKKMKAEV